MNTPTDWLSIYKGKPKEIRAWFMLEPFETPEAWINERQGKEGEYVCNLVFSGSGTYTVNRTRYVLQENDMILIPPLCRQSSHYKEKQAQAAGIFFSLRQYQPQHLRPLIFNAGRYATEIRRLFYTLSDEYLSKHVRYLRDKRLETVMQELLVLISRLLHEQENPVADHQQGKSELAHEIMKYLESYMGRPLRMEQVARYFYMTPQRFCTLFHDVHGVTPLQYLQQIRMKNACSWLSHSGMMVHEIASRCGYSSPIHFSQQFKKIHGCSPRRYRLHGPSVML